MIKMVVREEKEIRKLKTNFEKKRNTLDGYADMIAHGIKPQSLEIAIQVLKWVLKEE